MASFIFDLETDGLNPQHAEIIEIGIKLYNSQKEYNTLIKYNKNKLDPKITEITGIQLQDLNLNGIDPKKAMKTQLKVDKRNACLTVRLKFSDLLAKISITPIKRLIKDVQIKICQSSFPK